MKDNAQHVFLNYILCVYSPCLPSHISLKSMQINVNPPTHITNVKRYLRQVTITRDILLIIRDNQLVHLTWLCIVFPDLLTTNPIWFSQPTLLQIKQFLTDIFKDETLYAGHSSCHHCVSLEVVSIISPIYPNQTAPNLVWPLYKGDEIV